MTLVYVASGSSWVQDIPADWELQRLKSATRITLGKMLCTEESEKYNLQLPYVRAANLSDSTELNETELSQMWFSTAEAKSLALRNGDVIVAEGGSIGQPRIVEGVLDNELICFQNSGNRLRSAENHRFLFYCMRFWLTPAITKQCHTVSLVI